MLAATVWATPAAPANSPATATAATARDDLRMLLPLGRTSRNDSSNRTLAGARCHVKASSRRPLHEPPRDATLRHRRPAAAPIRREPPRDLDRGAHRDHPAAAPDDGTRPAHRGRPGRSPPHRFMGRGHGGTLLTVRCCGSTCSAAPCSAASRAACRGRVAILPQTVGAVVGRSAGGLVALQADGVAAIDDGRVRHLAAPDRGRPAPEPFQRRQVRPRRTLGGGDAGARQAAGRREPVRGRRRPDRAHRS